jgi:hypothetical protein
LEKQHQQQLNNKMPKLLGIIDYLLVYRPNLQLRLVVVVGVVAGCPITNDTTSLPAGWFAWGVCRYDAEAAVTV